MVSYPGLEQLKINVFAIFYWGSGLSVFFFSVYYVCLSWNVVDLFPLCFEGREVGSESEKELFNQLTMFVFPEMMLVFAYTSFP